VSVGRTPEEVARGDIPEQYARVVAVSISPSSRHAVVAMQTNEPPAVELYEVACELGENGWVEFASHSGGGLGSFFFDDGCTVETEWSGTDDWSAHWSREA